MRIQHEFTTRKEKKRFLPKKKKKTYIRKREIENEQITSDGGKPKRVGQREGQGIVEENRRERKAQNMRMWEEKRD